MIYQSSKEKRLRIAILGFGSLLWDESPEFDRWRGEWVLDGPSLPLEFSRISERRSGALTLVIYPEQRKELSTIAWCLSKRKDPDDAFCDLRCREGTNNGNIGKLWISDGLPPEQPAHLRVIYHWACAKNLDAVVWTALKSNFKRETNREFSAEEAINYLQTRLTPEGKAKAVEYIWRAPDFVKTPLRIALQGEPWFPKPKDAEKTD